MKLWATAFGALLLAACASAPPPPDWQANAFAALQGYTSAYLDGNTRLADVEWARARSEIARTGRTDLAARAELARCAVHAASLEWDHCPDYQARAQDAGPRERAYAAYLEGDWSGLDAALLPGQHRAVVQAPGQGASGLPAMEDPLARLVAAAARLQAHRLAPQEVDVAVDTASAQGWRRPLLAWLGVQLQRAQAAGDTAAAQRIQRRRDLVAPLSP